MIKKYKDVKRPKGVNCICFCCGEIFGGNSAGGCALYCQTCKTAPNRKLINEENEKINAQNNGK